MSVRVAVSVAICSSRDKIISVDMVCFLGAMFPISVSVRDGRTSFRLEFTLVDREFNGISGGTSPQIVQSGLEAAFPCVKMHRGHFTKRRLSYVNVERLTLVYVRASVRGHIDQILLRDLPHCSVEPLQIVRDRVDLLDGAIVRDYLVLNVVVPEAAIRQILKKVLIHDLKTKLISKLSINETDIVT